MDLALSLADFHFLRPAWLLLLPLAVLLPWLRRAEGGRLGWRSSISPTLLPYLIVDAAGSRGPRPVHALAALLAVGAIAAAGPAWERDRPAFLDNQAALVIAVDLSPSMDAPDLPPTRLQAVKAKLHDLLARRAGAKTGLVAYAGSAHVVLPPTDDPALLDLFIQALATDLIATPGKDAAGALRAAAGLFTEAQAGGTVLLVTDGADTGQLAQVAQVARQGNFQVLVWAAGVRDTGALRNARGQARDDALGRPLLGSFDADALRQLAQAARAPLGSLSVKDDDLDWVEQHAQRHFQAVQDAGGPVHWKDAGYWLCWPLALLALGCLRRGWNVNWTAGLALAWGLGFGLAPQPAQAAGWADAVTNAFFTPDQQGRWAYEHRRYAEAAAHFQDPYWKGRAAYDAGDYKTALGAFARVDTPEGYFYLGNTQARLRGYDQALAAFDEALRRRPDFPEARFNRDLVARMLAAMQSEAEDDPNETPDATVTDQKKGGGDMKAVTVAQAPSDDVWLRNLSLSPSGFLRQKFAVEDARQAAAPGGAP